MLLFKKLVTPFFMPLTIILFLSFVGLFLLWFSKKQKTGKLLITCGIFLLAAFSFNPIPDLLIEPLEKIYATYDLAQSNIAHPTKQRPAVEFVVVLGGGHITDPDIPLTGQINSSSLRRLIEGIRIYREHPGSKLVLSGGSVFNTIHEADTMDKIARSIGVPPADIILESASQDTKDQARNLKAIVEGKHFVLVTSASHMPRSIALFNTAGMNPIAAPTDYLLRKRQNKNPASFFPASHSLKKAERAIYEHLGMRWAKMRNQVK